MWSLNLTPKPRTIFFTIYHCQIFLQQCKQREGCLPLLQPWCPPSVSSVEQSMRSARACVCVWMGGWLGGWLTGGFTRGQWSRVKEGTKLWWHLTLNLSTSRYVKRMLLAAQSRSYPSWSSVEAECRRVTCFSNLGFSLLKFFTLRKKGPLFGSSIKTFHATNNALSCNIKIIIFCLVGKISPLTKTVR